MTTMSDQTPAVNLDRLAAAVAEWAGGDDMFGRALRDRLTANDLLPPPAAVEFVVLRSHWNDELRYVAPVDDEDAGGDMRDALLTSARRVEVGELLRVQILPVPAIVAAADSREHYAYVRNLIAEGLLP